MKKISIYSFQGFILSLVTTAVILGIATFTFYVTSRNTIERQIVKGIERNCSETIEDCSIIIANETKFHWDQMFIFDQGFDSDELEAIIGVRPNKDNFAAIKIIFLDDHRIVSYWQSGVDWEGGAKTQLYFTHPNTQDYSEYTPETATFSVQKSAGNPDFYTLEPALD